MYCLIWYSMCVTPVKVIRLESNVSHSLRFEPPTQPTQYIVVAYSTVW